MTRQERHDDLLRHMPEGASHDAESCPLCVTASTQEEDVADKIFTQEQHEQLLESAVQKAVLDATKATDTEVLRLNERIEAAEKELAERDQAITELEEQVSDRERQDHLEALAEERAKLVQAEVSFSEEQIEARRLAWAGMEEDEFGEYLKDLKVVAKATDDGKKAPKTKFDGTRAVAELETNAVKAFFDSDVVV